MVKKVWDGYEVGEESLGLACTGGPRVGVKGKGIVLGPRMGMLGLVWVWRALVGRRGPEMGVRVFKCVWRAWDGY